MWFIVSAIDRTLCTDLQFLIAISPNRGSLKSAFKNAAGSVIKSLRGRKEKSLMWTSWRILVILDNYSSAGVETAIKRFEIQHFCGIDLRMLSAAYNVDAKPFCVLLYFVAQLPLCRNYPSKDLRKRSKKYSLINGKGFFHFAKGTWQFEGSVEGRKNCFKTEKNSKSCVLICIETT